MPSLRRLGPMENVEQLLMTTMLGQAIWRWAASILTAMVFLIVVAFLRRRAGRLEDDGGIIGDVQAGITSIRRMPTFLIAIYLGTQWLTLSSAVATFLYGVFIIAAGYQLGISSVVIVRRLLQRNVVNRDRMSGASLGVLGTLAEGVIWVLLLLTVLSNLGINVSGFVASLGVGGIAVALAAQNILGDLFASLSIVFDRPFEPGDFIKVGNELGTVRRIGLKTTRVVALQGEELVFSNTDLLSSRIQNYKKMQERRVVLQIGVVYDTTLEHLKEVPDLIEAAVRSADDARFDRAHFTSFGDSALMFEAVYYIPTGDYRTFLDRQQAINLTLLSELRNRGIDVAFPTQTLHVASAPPREDLPPIRSVAVSE